jgi:hypothetical protein
VGLVIFARFARIAQGEIKLSVPAQVEVINKILGGLRNRSGAI